MSRDGFVRMRRASKPGRDRPEIRYCEVLVADEGDNWDAEVRCMRRLKPGEITCYEHADANLAD